MNEWPVRNNKELMIKQHENIQQRIDLGLKLKDQYKFKMPLYIDTFKNEMIDIYAGWPLQSFIICNDKIKWNIKPKKPEQFICSLEFDL